MTEKREPLFTSNDWTFELLHQIYEECDTINREELQLDVYQNQIEIISSEQMLDCYASVGLPVFYNHWSFGKQFLMDSNNYKAGRSGLAYEIVINTNPARVYCMENNTATMQALVISHAGFGHNFFFKNNYLFKQWTDAESIVDYLVFAKNYISDCEEKYGNEAVEDILDSCHAIQNYGVFKYKRPSKLSAANETKKQKSREKWIQAQLNDLWNRTVPKDELDKVKAIKFPSEPEENLLYFIEKNAPNMEQWQREIVRIVRKVAQYFYPQRQTQVGNEGIATFVHHYMMTRLHEKGIITEGSYLEFLDSHTGVVFQPDFDSPYFSGINPYALGFAMFQDIKRICENPTEEDKRWFPELIGQQWLDVFKHAVSNFKDESFISQYLSPKVIRDFKLFSVYDHEDDDQLEISAIHDDEGYKKIREKLSSSYNLSHREPQISVDEVDVWGDRSLTLVHKVHNRRLMEEQSAKEVLRHVGRLWGFPVVLNSRADNGTILSSHTVDPADDE